MSVGTCRLCLKLNSTLRKSHIIPEFFYKNIYTRSHRNFVAFPIFGKERLQFRQRGFVEYLLCDSCETKLSVWENSLRSLKDEIVSFKKIATDRLQYSVAAYNSVNYSYIKLAILSIFWRANISSLPVFAGYELGPYAEKIRKILNSGIAPIDSDFPVFMTRGLIDEMFYPAMILLLKKSRQENYFVQTIVLNGIIFECFICENKPIPAELILFALRSNGSVLVSDMPYEDFGINRDSELSVRLKRSDARKFFQRYR